MFIAKVKKRVISTQKNEQLKGHKLLVIDPLDLELKSQNKEFIALDIVDAGVDDIVLFIKEGGSAAVFTGVKKAVYQCVIVGVVDGLTVHGERII